MKFAKKFDTESDAVSKAIQYLLTDVFVFFLIIVQTTLVHAAAVFHVVPALTFVFCVCYSVKKGGVFAVVLSALCGFLLDILNGRPQGCDALLYMYISLGCVWLYDCVYNKSLKVIMLCVLTASVLYGAASFGINFLLWGETRAGYAFFHKIVPESLYNLIITPILYPFVCKCVGSNGVGRSVYRE